MSDSNEEISLPVTPRKKIVVDQNLTTPILYHNEIQPLNLKHCVQHIHINDFYGDFELYDTAKRLWAKSEKSQLWLLKHNMFTETACVIYDMRSLCHEYKTLVGTYGVKDPGLDCSNLPLFIRLVDAPDFSAERTRIPHISVFFKVTNVWDQVTQTLLF